jgi:hypothetical protein
VATPDKMDYLLTLLRTGGGLGIFAPYWWLAGLAELSINLLSAQPSQYSGFYHYNAVLLAALMAGAVYGAAALRQARLAAVLGTVPPSVGAPSTLAGYAERLARWWARLLGRIPLSPHLIGPLVVVWLLVATGWNLAGITYKLQGFWQAGSAPSTYQAQIDALLHRIPPNAVVAATDTLDPHLTDRETIYLLPDPLAYQAQYVVVDLSAVDPASQAADEGMFTAMVSSRRYRVLGIAGPVVLMERVGSPLAGA